LHEAGRDSRAPASDTHPSDAHHCGSRHARAEEVGAHADRIGLAFLGQLGADRVADQREQIATVDATADHPATAQLGGVLPNRFPVDGNAPVELIVHARTLGAACPARGRRCPSTELWGSASVDIFF
jgi:hypothetical protein